MNYLLLLPLIANSLAYEGEVRFSEDTLGNYNLNYDAGLSSRKEQRMENGEVSGKYIYVDPENMKHDVEYEAGKNGFVARSNDIPTSVPEPLDVVKVRRQHLKGAEKHLGLEEYVDYEIDGDDEDDEEEEEEEETEAGIVDLSGVVGLIEAKKKWLEEYEKYLKLVEKKVKDVLV